MSQTNTVGKHATTISKHGENMVIRYHSTNIVTFDDTHVMLDNGRWWTNTTKTRMNQASSQFDLGYRVHQKDYEWYIETPFDGVQKFSDRGTFTFRYR